MRPITSLPNTEAPDADFPGGRLKNTVGANAGTRVNESMVGDWSQFFYKLMNEAGVTPNGLPDSEYSGFQLMTALVRIFGGMRRIVYEIGAWNMDADASKIVSTDVVFSKVRGISFVIINDAGDAIYPNGLTQTAFTPELEAAAGGTNTGGELSILMSRTTGGFFDDAGFNDTAVNRGYVIVEFAVDDY